MRDGGDERKRLEREGHCKILKQQINITRMYMPVTHDDTCIILKMNISFSDANMDSLLCEAIPHILYYYNTHFSPSENAHALYSIISDLVLVCTNPGTSVELPAFLAFSGDRLGMAVRSHFGSSGLLDRDLMSSGCSVPTRRLP